MTRFLLYAVVLVAPSLTHSADPITLRCGPVGGTDYWIRSVTVDVGRKRVQILVANDPEPKNADLVHIEQSGSGEISYHFNWRVPGSDPVVNAFKLFRATDGWRLIDVGLELRGSNLALRALGSSQRFACK